MKNVSAEMKSQVDVMYGQVMKEKCENLLINKTLITAKHGIHKANYMNTNSTGLYSIDVLNM